MKIALALVLTSSACMVGSIETTSGGGGGVDAGGSGSGSGSGSAGTGSGSGSGSGFACRNPLPAPGDGHHNAGLDCMNGCHNHGFTLAGTLYAANKTSPVVGASITVVDANGATFDMVTMTNGNFYTSTAVKLPVTVTASSCPSVSPMIGKASTGGCNNTSCHGGAQGAIHLP
jgi:hypothetical protein